MKKSLAGFTLIELMVVSGLLGLLFVLMIPVYQGYMIKSHFSLALDELAKYKTAYEVQITRSGGVTNSDIGYGPSKFIVSEVNRDIAVSYADGSGAIEVLLGGIVHNVLRGATLRLVRTSNGVWNCTVRPLELQKWKSEYAPKSCIAI